MAINVLANNCHYVWHNKIGCKLQINVYEDIEKTIVCLVALETHHVYASNTMWIKSI